MRGAGDWAAARAPSAPGTPGAASAGDRSRLRASEADREQAAEVLKAAFVERRLAKEEFDLRVGRALTALTYADLDALTDDIPAGPPPQGQPVAVKANRRNPVAPRPSATPSDHRPTRALALIAQATWARRQLVSLMAGLLLLGAGVMLPNPAVLICGLLVVGMSAPQATPSNPQAAMVHTWQWLHHSGTTQAARHRASHQE